VRLGARHPLHVGADGVAILAGRPPMPGDPKDVERAGQKGYALSVGAIQASAVGVAAPLLTSDWATASIGVVQLGTKVSDAQVPELVMAAAADAARRLAGDYATEAHA
jgi:DNA-binding IclR family transcriptional regulator